MNHRRVIATVVGLGCAVCAGFGWADDWASPKPTSYHCRGFGYVAEVFPPKSRQNPTDMPVCYLYSMGYPGRTEWKIDAQLVWKAPLINAGTYHMPYEALVSMDGILVTLNDYGRIGYKDAVVIYDKDGKPIKSYALDDLVPKEDLAKSEQTISSRWWNRGAKYFFLRRPDRFYIVLKWGKAMEFAMKDGAFKYGLPTAFPDLVAASKQAHPDEEVEVWSTSLRFSSITDVLATGPATRPAEGKQADASELNEAVSIGITKLAEQPKPAEAYKLVGAQQLVLQGKYIWRLTFKPERLLPADPTKQAIGAGGEVFINVDLKTRTTTVLYGE